MAGLVAPTDDLIFANLFKFAATVIGLPNDTDKTVKGFQNNVAQSTASHVVISPGILQRQDFGRRRFEPGPDPDNQTGQIVQQAHITYSWQVDCYGQDGPNWAIMLATAWETAWGVDSFKPDGVVTPLYADAPRQVNIVNSEGQYEQRQMVRLFGQVNYDVTLPQDYFTQVDVDTIVAANQLP